MQHQIYPVLKNVSPFNVYYPHYFHHQHYSLSSHTLVKTVKLKIKMFLCSWEKNWKLNFFIVINGKAVVVDENNLYLIIYLYL